MRISVFAAASTLCLMLAGCGGNPDPIWQQAFGYTCSNRPSASADAICQNRPAEPENVSRFCYETLGDPNCFDQPDEISKNQELGSSGK